MKLSIFPEANPHPKNKEEKRIESFKVSSPYLPTTVSISTDEDLIKYVTNYAWSPFVFSGTRHANNFVGCDFLVYDIDEGLTIEEAKSIVEARGLCCLCLPSPSHSEEAHRFRIVLPLAKTISTADVYEETWRKGAELFGNVDEQCKDRARYFFGSTMVDGFWNEGKFFEPIAPKKKMEQAPAKVSEVMLPVDNNIKEIVSAIYGEERKFIPEAVEYFITNAHTGLPGHWINSLNAFCFSLSLSGIEEDAILTVCKQLAPNDLDQKDLYQIKKSIQDAKKV